MTESAIRSTAQAKPGDGERSTAGSIPSLTKAGGSYTRFANSMRIVLPLVAVAIIVLVVAWPQITEKPKKFSLSLTSVTTTETGTQQIINARFTGTDSKNRPYSVTADTASQVKNKPDMIELAFPKADMTLRTGAWLALSAETGQLNRKNQELDLQGKVNLFHDKGYELSTSVAKIFMKDGVASGDKPVTGQGPAGTIKSAGFRILDGGRRVIFTGRSELVLYRTKHGPKG
jgi:lipopolysaccharide export system protein LptC